MMRRTVIGVLSGLIIALLGCDDGNQSASQPNQPFKLPSGETAYPDGTIATYLDSPERKRQASLLTWPDPLLGWLSSFWSYENTRVPKTMGVSDQSCFVLIELECASHPEVGVRDHRIISFKLLAIEPHINAGVSELAAMTVTVNGEPTRVTVETERSVPSQDVIESATLFNPALNQLAGRVVVIELHNETYALGEYITDIQIEFIDQDGTRRTDHIDAIFKLH